MEKSTFGIFHDNLQTFPEAEKNSQETCYKSLPLAQEQNPDVQKMIQKWITLTLQFQ